MIRMKISTAAFAAAIFVAAPAHGQSIEYDCDTGADHFSELKLTQTSGDHRVTGSMTVRAMYPSKAFATLGSVNISAPDGSWSVRLAITGLVKKSKSINIGELRIMRDGNAQETQVGIFEAGKPVPFSLSVNADGTGEAKLGDNSLPVPIAASGPMSASVVCSTGEVLFTELDLGR
jgi:hypothetical protein